MWLGTTRLDSALTATFRPLGTEPSLVESRFNSANVQLFADPFANATFKWS